jgi:hypothetical protein
LYGLKRASDDIAALAKEVGAPRIILGGHDWYAEFTLTLNIPTSHVHVRGGFVVWRAAQWYPDLISHVFSVCTPYTPPHGQYFSTEDLVKGPLPQFAYQLHLASGEVEKSVKDEQSIRQFLKGVYGARGPNGELVFDPEKGIIAENLPKIGESRILNGEVSSIPYNRLIMVVVETCGSPEYFSTTDSSEDLGQMKSGLLIMTQMLEYYVKQYSRHGVHSTRKPTPYCSK